MELAEVTARHAVALAGMDPLLPAPGALVADDDASVLSARDGASHAAGVARCVTVDADTEGALWGALRTHRLTAQLAGPDRGAAMAALLAAWEPVVAAGAAAGDLETAAVVTVASRDTAAALPLVRHGFAPLTVVAVRRERPGAVARPRSPGVRLMRDADLDAVAAMAVELHRADLAFGMVSERPDSARLLRAGIEAQWARAAGHTWVAQDGAAVVGFAQVQPAAETGWVAGLVAGPAPAYFGYLYVRPGARGAGAGSALVDAAHAAIARDADGAGGPATTLLHHALPSPHSTPFWARHGYRPLWTSYQRRPAVAAV